jgi:hypothetical protein
MRRYHKFTPEEIQFLKDNTPGRSRAEITELFNRRFGRSMTASQMRGLLGYYKICAGTHHKYTPEEMQFLRDNLPCGSFDETVELFNQRFGGSMTKRKIIHLGHRYGIRCAADKQSAKIIGVETKKGEYKRVKTDNTRGAYLKNWKKKHYLIWEAANGPVPEGHIVIFADRNKSNFDLDNLLLASRKELVVMNRKRLIFPDKDLTKTGKTVADMILLIGDRERKIGKRPYYKEKKE